VPVRRAARHRPMWKPPPGTRGPVLVVDDDDGFRSMIVSALEYCGYLSLEASSGEEALETVSTAMPMLVVLDVHLPSMSGYEVCRALRGEFGDALPIIFVSGERTM